MIPGLAMCTDSLTQPPPPRSPWRPRCEPGAGSGKLSDSINQHAVDKVTMNVNNFGDRLITVLDLYRTLSGCRLRRRFFNKCEINLWPHGVKLEDVSSWPIDP